jgi:phosphomannomutase
LLTTIQNNRIEKCKVVIGRDGRISGKMVKDLVNATLISLGIDIIDLDYSTTPTVEMAVKFLNADGGIILTASHNPMEWNALKLLNNKGEFISGDEGKLILQLAEKEAFEFSSIEKHSFSFWWEELLSADG